jgi:alginate O-acetyltransferase complex protein AlgI
MTFVQILVFAAVSLAAGAIPRARAWLLCVASVLAVYWLQPALPVRNLDFWLPTASIALAACIWAATLRKPAAGPAVPGAPASGSSGFTRADLLTAAVIGATIAGAALLRYADFAGFLTASRPPDIVWVAAALAAALLAAVLLWKLSARRWVFPVAIAALIGLFLVLKTDSLAQTAAALLRSLAGQSPALASAPDVRWLGFSYIAFRLIHTLRDRMTGRLPDVPLREYLTYIIFFPTITAGPIDRVERFAKDLRAPAAPLSESFFPAGERILAGLFKKFVLADGLAILALNAVNAAQVTAAPWLWLLVYAYAFRIYFDFAGYTDIALGLGRWMGFTLPENFNRPYLQANLTAFWNSWHMTLAQWFRAYFFNPLTRALRSGNRAIPMAAIIFIGQIATFALIGLWHGVTWNFLIWGCWHGIGLFAHNRWGEWSRGWVGRLDARPPLKSAYTIVSTLGTFQYVALGWIWFALPSVETSARVFLRLFGMGG